MKEMQFYENGQGYTKDLIAITNEKFAALLSEELNQRYQMADFYQSQYRFDVYLTDIKYCVHIKVLSYYFGTNDYEINHIWRTDLDRINSIFMEGDKP